MVHSADRGFGGIPAVATVALGMLLVINLAGCGGGPSAPPHVVQEQVMEITPSAVPGTVRTVLSKLNDLGDDSTGQERKCAIMLGLTERPDLTPHQASLIARDAHKAKNVTYQAEILKAIADKAAVLSLLDAVDRMEPKTKSGRDAVFSVLQTIAARDLVEGEPADLASRVDRIGSAEQQQEFLCGLAHRAPVQAILEAIGKMRCDTAGKRARLAVFDALNRRPNLTEAEADLIGRNAHLAGDKAGESIVLESISGRRSRGIAQTQPEEAPRR